MKAKTVTSSTAIFPGRGRGKRGIGKNFFSFGEFYRSKGVEVDHGYDIVDFYYNVSSVKVELADKVKSTDGGMVSFGECTTNRKSSRNVDEKIGRGEEEKRRKLL